MKKILLILFALLLVSTFVSAETFKQSTDILISEPVRLDGMVESTINANITIKNPNNKILVNWRPMINNASIQEHQYFLSSHNTSIVGEYTYCITASAKGQNKTGCFEFEITPTGTQTSTSQGLIWLAMLMLSSGFFVLVLYGAITIPFQNNKDMDGLIIDVNSLKYFKVGLWFGVYLLMVWISFIAWNISESFLYFTLGGSIFKILFFSLGALTAPFFLLTIYILIVTWVKDSEIADFLSRGLEA